MNSTPFRFRILAPLNAKASVAIGLALSLWACGSNPSSPPSNTPSEQPQIEPGPEGATRPIQWYRASNLKNLNPGDSVPSASLNWIDEMGRYSVSTSGSVSGIYQTGGGPNGYPSVEIKSSQRLRVSSSASTYPGQGQSFTYVFVLVRSGAISARQALIHHGDNGTPNRANYLGFGSSTSITFGPSGYSTGPSTIIATIPPHGGIETYIGMHDTTGATDRPGVTLWRNGVELATLPTATTPGSSSPQFAVLGTRNGNNTAGVQLLEVIFYDRALSAIERCRLAQHIDRSYSLGQNPTCP